jgi:uncharacterized protein YegP (UPF0339 family)
MKLEIFKDKTGDWRWHLRARNGNIIAESGEGYDTLAACARGARKTEKFFVGNQNLPWSVKPSEFKL